MLLASPSNDALLDIHFVGDIKRVVDGSVVRLCDGKVEGVDEDDIVGV